MIDLKTLKELGHICGAHIVVILDRVIEVMLDAPIIVEDDESNRVQPRCKIRGLAILSEQLPETMEPGALKTIKFQSMVALRLINKQMAFGLCLKNYTNDGKFPA